MPEEYVHKLADSGIITVRHFLPSLQQKIDWPEQQRKIILVGARGEVPNLHKSPVKPMVQPVPQGTISLGHELHRGMDVKVDDTVKLMGKEFRVHACHKERGNKDDITAWIYLAEAQELLDKPDQINAILALECLCAGEDALPRIRREIAAILPDTQVIERGSRTIARAEARLKVAEQGRMMIEKEKRDRQELRSERERLASILTPIVVTACAVWIAVLGLTNVRARREEIGILRTVGVSAKGIFLLFIEKHISIGILGGSLGFLLGSILAIRFGSPEQAGGIGEVGSLPFWLGMVALAVMGASLLAVIAGWIPAMIASSQDPAEVLRVE